MLLNINWWIKAPAGLFKFNGFMSGGGAHTPSYIDFGVTLIRPFKWGSHIRGIG